MDRSAKSNAVNLDISCGLNGWMGGTSGSSLSFLDFFLITILLLLLLLLLLDLFDKREDGPDADVDVDADADADADGNCASGFVDVEECGGNGDEDGNLDMMLYVLYTLLYGVCYNVVILGLVLVVQEFKGQVPSK